MKNKITLLFAALMMTLGVSAQEGTTVEERGEAKGYYPFAAEIVKMKKLTTLDELTDGKQILIQDCQTSSYLTINSLSTGGEGGYHEVFMHKKPTGVGMWTTEVIADAEQGTFKLQSPHMVITGNKCYLGQVSNTGINTASKDENIGTCKFTPANDGRWTIEITNIYGYLRYLSVDSYSDISFSQSISDNNYFNIYEVEETKGIIKYVEATVKLTGAAGNVFTTEHEGWSDFYELSTESYDSYSNYKVLNNYGVALSNVYYHEESNEITGGIRFPFSVSGKIAKIPVHLCSYGSEDKRFTVGENNTVKVITRPTTPTEGDGWFKNQENQWYIIPSFDANDNFVYSIQNVATGQYLYSELNSYDLKLSDTPTYFKLYQTAPSGMVRFGCPYTNASGTSYLTFLCENSAKGHTTYTAGTSTNFLVPRVSGEEAGGYDAIGFTRTYHSDTYFWDGGEIAMDDAPADLKAVFEDENHEGYDTEGSEHRIYTANTGIYVPKMGDVTVTFNYLGGGDRLTILGVDIVDALGDIVSSEYHLGYAGDTSSENEYLVKDVPVGNYFLRYWICNRTDYEDGKNHNLSKNSGKIVVTGADYYLTYSDAPTNGAFSSNSTWYRMRLSDGLEKYISAQPNYVDADNNLMLTNNTPPNDYAGLWAIVGDKENGYKFYNRAWGPEYAMKTVGENGEARTYMVPAAEASTYDIVQQDRSQKDYKFYVKLHGTDNNYLNDHANSGYLATWNTSGALGNSGSVMTFETLNMEVFEANTTIVKNALVANWNPWVGNPKVSEFVASISDSFAELMLKRNDFSILDGKVFMFVNKGETEADNRRGCVLRVDADNNMAGVVSQGDLVDDFLQIVDNGNGTFKLLHLATNKYFQTPDANTITENAADAAAYSYKVYGDEVQALCFISGNQMMHLSNWDYTTMHYDDINNGASRWDVIYDVDAQELADLIAQVKARYAATQEDAYQANVGVPGYANAESTTTLLNTFNGGLAGMTFAEATTALTDAMNGVSTAERTAVYPTDCYFTITNCGTTNEPRNLSVIYDANKANMKDQNDGVSEFLWHNTSPLDKNNPDHLWCFYRNKKNGQHYLYNVGKKQFASPTGKGDYGLTWIFSDTPVAITMTDLGAETPTFHIKGGNETMSVSTGYAGSVITWYSNGDAGVPFKFEKSELEFEEINLEPRLAPGFYTLKCGNAYLSDDRYTDDTTRSMTEGTPGIKNIFYNTEDNALVGFASGFGFVYATCNTGRPEDGYNTFEYGYGDETGTFTVKSQQGTTNPENANWNAGRYFKKDGGKLLYTTTLEDADSWTIEKVTELPVKLTTAQNLTEGGAYGTIWSPVALEIPEGITAYTGHVTSECELVLEAITGGVIPAETGVVLWNEKAESTYVQNLKITDAAATAVSGDNKFVGWALTKANPNTNDGDYYSLGIKNNNMAFYRYVGKNLQGFRARIEKGDAPANASALTMRFNNATGIEEVISAFQNGAVYDLSGRRVATPTKGVYIVNGKKVFIK